MSKYIIYTMGIKEINEMVKTQLQKKGYRLGGWVDKAWVIWIYGNVGRPHDVYMGSYTFEFSYKGFNKERSKGYKEITFRELCELPPVHDELRELVTMIVKAIDDYCDKYPRTNMTASQQIKEIDWRKVREKVEEKLGL